LRFFLILLFLFLTSWAKTSYEIGKNLYMQKNCYTCHGIKLEGLHKYPYLANRAKGYMTYKLKRFRSKISDNQQQEMMISFAINLSDEDIDNLTEYMYNYVDDIEIQRYDDSFQTYGDGGS